MFICSQWSCGWLIKFWLLKLFMITRQSKLVRWELSISQEDIWLRQNSKCIFVVQRRVGGWVVLDLFICWSSIVELLMWWRLDGGSSKYIIIIVCKLTLPVNTFNQRRFIRNQVENNYMAVGSEVTILRKRSQLVWKIRPTTKR